MIRRFPLTFSDGDREYNGVSSNVSPSGIFIRTRKALPPGTILKIVLEIDGNTKVTLEGEVAWALKTGLSDFRNGMGIEFSHVPEEYEAFIKRLGL
jgi:uncharacterized protein (TIGR02266 family)